jgi:hypothetical protein
MQADAVVYNTTAIVVHEAARRSQPPVQYNLNMNGSQAVSGFNSHTTPGLQNDSEFILIQQRMRIFMWYFSNY